LDVTGQTATACDTNGFPCGTMKGYWWDFAKLSAEDFLSMADATVIDMPAVNAYYAYSYPYSWSANTGRETSNGVSMFFIADNCNGGGLDGEFYYFYILDKAWDGSGGNLQLKVTGTDPVFTATPSKPNSFHDGYTTADGASETFSGSANIGTLGIMLRDDPWNTYTYVPASGSNDDYYYFTWNWLQCCTDGMILGPMPTFAQGFNITFEGDCSTMQGLEQGTRISMWNPFGPPYNPTTTGGCQQGTSGKFSNWVTYDVPMDMMCEETKGIQVGGQRCDIVCPFFTDCGSCQSNRGCGWDEADNSCKSKCLVAGLTEYGTTCSVCSAITDPFACMCEEGCGWAPLDGASGLCISGTPDHPSDQSVTVVQWQTKGCPADCSHEYLGGTDVHNPHDRPILGGVRDYYTSCCPRKAPKMQCYRAAYNDKHAYAGISLTEEYGVLPATAYPAHHPKVKAFGSDEKAHLPARDFWRRYEARPNLQPAQTYNGSVVFFAYDYPDKYSSNTGYETSDSLVTFMVQGDDCQTYILVLLDNTDNTGGTATIDMTSTDAPCDPVIFRNDPQDQFDSDDVENWHACGQGQITWKWEPGYNDGMVVGPLPYGVDWSVLMKLEKQSRGLDTFKIGTYDSDRNDIGFVSADIRKATHRWGGLKYDAMECTHWCQRYSDCSSCTKDESCTFSSAHGGCIAADAYIYDYGCAHPAEAPETRIMFREPDSFERESVLDGWDSGMVIRFTLPSVDMSCPCSTRYKYCSTIYDENMSPIYRMDCTPPRLDYPHTFVDLPTDNENNGETVLQDGGTYHVYSYLCVDQGTLNRDDCSPVSKQTLTISISPPTPSPPPPSPSPPPPNFGR